jgi:1-deoxy-D-xylulose-5-phosphate reductoisomerase
MQNMVILGATGSIGASTLSVIANNAANFNVYGLVANVSVDKMLALCITHQPEYAHMVDQKAAMQLSVLLPQGCLTQVTTGAEALNALVTDSLTDTVMAAIVGAAGLVPTFDAVKAGKRVLLANKEALVMSGELCVRQERLVRRFYLSTASIMRFFNVYRPMFKLN